MTKKLAIFLLSVMFFKIDSVIAQLFVSRDTVTVYEAGKVLKLPWANGLNNVNVSNLDLNFDGKKDLVVFDKVTQFSVGRFRCFINVGNVGETKYIAKPELSYSFPPVSNWAVCLDYNCDGKEDLFASVNGGISVYKNISTPSVGVAFSLVKSLVYSDFNPQGPPSLAFLYASTIGVPGLADIDNDGDIDVLTFSPGGFYIEYHKNMSKELYNHCDSLVYQLEDACWGKISEQNCTVSMNECPLRPVSNQFYPPIDKKRHAGSCLMCFDSNGDNLQDLIMGDIVCSTVQFASNTGSITNAVITDTTKLYPNYPNKNNTLQIKLNNFPCTYYVDCDGDGKKDLIASPNAFGSENTLSMWYYKNASSTNTVNFQFVKKNFLQDEMIEVGQNSFPVVFDYNADGKKDLLIGTYGYYNNISLTSKLTLYENIGTPSQPTYSLITRDYAGISTYGLNAVVPTVGDIDSDGDVDICLGTANGQIHWLKNSGGAGNPCIFSNFLNNPFGFITNSAAASPQLFDIDKDGKLDLMIGTKNGRIAFYKNVGSSTVPSFNLITNFFGSIDVKGDPNSYGIDGYASPYFFNEGATTKILVGNVHGQLFYFDVPNILSDPCILIDVDANNYNEGGQATVCFEDVNNDNKRDLFIGNGSGGLSYFSSMGPEVSVKELQSDIDNVTSVYPNPAKDYFYLSIRNTFIESGEFIITDLMGKKVSEGKLSSNFEAIRVSDFKPGFYLFKIIIYNGKKTNTYTKKIVKE
ncbi:MAG: T9SS type A sorting domain-containing protein [Bacteroidia bacterium]|nr:T9SS type A sorting domain-containing protein [Bacteroidia bacterium]